MRIIGGKHRSRILAEFAGEEVRPTSDRVKESLFNILSLKLQGARVLDLFAGCGSLGLESLSRGAREAVFNDCAKDSLAILRKNLAALKIVANGEEAKIYNYDYLTCLDCLRGDFDLIFLDPPYKSELGEKTIAFIESHNLLSPNGKIIYEHINDKKLLPKLLKRYIIEKTKIYGDKVVEFISNQN